MDVVLANKRPLAGPRRASAELWERVARRQPAHADRGDRRRRAADLRQLPQARRIGRPRPEDRRVPVGDAGLRADGGRARQVLLGGARARDGARLHRARPARRSVGRRRGPQGADPRAAARVRGRARRTSPSNRWCRRRCARSRATPSSSASPTWTPTGRSAPRPRRRRARRCATSPRSARTRSPSACRPWAARAPSSASRGPTTRSRSRPLRYRKNPLVITGPGAGPAVTAAGVLNDLLRLT